MHGKVLIQFRPPYAIKNQRGANIWMPELVLYSMRLLATELLGSVLEIEVDNPGPELVSSERCWMFNVQVSLPDIGSITHTGHSTN